MSRLKNLKTKSFYQNYLLLEESQTQHNLFNFNKTWQKCLNKSGVKGTVLIYLRKAYDCLPHDLPVNKLDA